jgi:pimeloyl-ACP methyl ester carboxylesterase
MGSVGSTSMRSTSDIVIVHGGWGGGWEWKRVARKLRQNGHEVFAPTLTGLGEREHLGVDVGLSDHIDDVLALIRFERLRDLVLCGHSYGGMVVTGVADRVPECVRLLVYLDGFVPRDGQALLDLVPGEFAESLLQAASEREDGKIPIPPELEVPEGVLPDEVRNGYVSRTRPHPRATMTDPIRLSGAVDRVRRAYVRCTAGIDPDNDLMADFVARARGEGWLLRESPTPHDLQLFDPDGTADIIDDLAAQVE